ncbi:MAG: YceI family protein [Vicinamibacterales bacterium]
MFSLIAVLAFVIGTAGADAQTPAPAGDDVWNIDTAHTSAQFAARHMLVSTVRGTLGPVKGTVRWDGKNVKTAQVDATIDVAGLSTANQKRDDHLRSADFFDAANHPTITFKSKRVEPAGEGRFKLTGDLTIRGNTHEVALDVEGPTPPVKMRNSFRTGASASGKVSRKQFGLLWNNLMETGGAVVGDDVQMTIDIEMTKQAATSSPQ